MTTCLDAQHRYKAIVQRAPEQHAPHVAAAIAFTERALIPHRPTLHPIPRQLAVEVVEVALVL